MSCRPVFHRTVGRTSGSGRSWFFPGPQVRGISTPRTKTCPWGPRTWGTHTFCVNSRVGLSVVFPRCPKARHLHPKDKDPSLGSQDLGHPLVVRTSGRRSRITQLVRDCRLVECLKRSPFGLEKLAKFIGRGGCRVRRSERQRARPGGSGTRIRGLWQGAPRRAGQRSWLCLPGRQWRRRAGIRRRRPE